MFRSSEALGPQHGVQQVRPDEHTKDEQEHVDHGYTLSQSRMKRNIAQNVASPSAIIPASSMAVVPFP
jgi:hypothetical protein